MNNENKLDKYLIIVNKDLPLTEEKEKWLKENFEYVPYTDEDGESFMELETFKAYTALIKLMKRKYLINVDSHSAGRSAATQEKIYKELAEKYGEEWAKTHVSSPDTSEHRIGLAFDLRFKFIFVPEALRSEATTLAHKLKIKDKIFQTIEKEAAQFGLIKRYHTDKEDITGVANEDWHFRYVGKEHAIAMYKSGMCLEEYVKELKLKNGKIKQAAH